MYSDVPAVNGGSQQASFFFCATSKCGVFPIWTGWALIISLLKVRG